MKGKIVTAALVAMGIFAASGYTAVAEMTQTQPTTQQNRSRLSGQDRLFMTQAAQGNLAEIRLSELALERASSDDVKEYAQMMIDQHTQALEQLQQIAAQKGVQLPNELDAQHRRIESQLRQLSGASFDRGYMTAMYQDHGKTAALFQSQAARGQDADAKAYASNLLPAIQQHYQMASTMVRSLAAR